MDFNEKIDRALGTLQTDMNKLTVMVAENTCDLKNHMERTKLNEERIQNLEKWLLGLLSAILVSVLIKIYF